MQLSFPTSHAESVIVEFNGVCSFAFTVHHSTSIGHSVKDILTTNNYVYQRTVPFTPPRISRGDEECKKRLRLH